MNKDRLSKRMDSNHTIRHSLLISKRERFSHVQGRHSCSKKLTNE